MSWKLTAAPKTLKITKSLVKEFVDMERAPQDRSLSERRVDIYAKIAQRGEFRPVQWASAKCGETGSVYRVNGKHTSTMLSRLEALPEMYAVVERYYCDSLEDVARLYSTYDSRLQSRNTADINRSFASCIPELHEVSTRCLNRAVTGIAYYTHQERYGQIQPAERAEALLEHSGFVLWLHEVCGAGQDHHGFLGRFAVASAMFGSYQLSKSDATKFWLEVREGTHPLPTSPSRKLQRFLLTNFHKQGRSDAPSRYRVSDREFFVKSIAAWNAWRKDENTDLRYYAEAKIPKMV